MSILLPKHKENHTTPLPLIVWSCGAFQVVDKDIWIPQLVPLAKQGFIIASVESDQSGGEGDWPDYLHCADSFQQDQQGNHERQNQAYAEK